jgi:hypothetical protein
MSLNFFGNHRFKCVGLPGCVAGFIFGLSTNFNDKDAIGITLLLAGYCLTLNMNQMVVIYLFKEIVSIEYAVVR